MTIVRSAQSGIPVTIQDGETTGDGLVIAVPTSFRRHQLIITNNSEADAGAVQPESLDNYDDEDGSPLGGGPIAIASIPQQVYNFEGIYRFIRCPITTNVTNGTVTVQYLGGQ